MSQLFDQMNSRFVSKIKTWKKTSSTLSKVGILIDHLKFLFDFCMKAILYKAIKI